MPYQASERRDPNAKHVVRFFITERIRIIPVARAAMGSRIATKADYTTLVAGLDKTSPHRLIGISKWRMKPCGLHIGFNPRTGLATICSSPIVWPWLRDLGCDSIAEFVALFIEDDWPLIEGIYNDADYHAAIKQEIKDGKYKTTA